MSPSSTPSRLAWAGLIRAALSQVRRVMGLGSSCSQALLANRPSHTAGSGRKTSSRATRSAGAGRRARDVVAARRHRLGLPRRAGDLARAQGLAPGRFEVAG